nr:hypothetical protein [Tanacetum cinerariifolium]GFB98945.1 hypothetical protein [Tanacetum cinerariifolium]
EECKPAPKKPTTAVAKSGKKASVSSEENTQDDGGNMDAAALLLIWAVAAKYHSVCDDAAFADSDTDYKCAEL